MSRVGKNPVSIPTGVTVDLKDQVISVKGPKGTLELKLVPDVQVNVNDGKVLVTPSSDSKKSRMMWGTTRNLIRNLVDGVSKGYTVKLEMEGVGYRAAVQGKTLTMQLGYSHDVVLQIPEGLTVACEKPTAIAVSGIDNQRVGQFAAEIRSWRLPEPYKGKGIRYEGETILRKEGKKK